MEWMFVRKGKRCFKPRFSICMLFWVACAGAQSSTDSLNNVTRSASFYFVQHDGSCQRGSIIKADSNEITIRTSEQTQAAIMRESLLQVRQGDGLIYSARSSWSDVAKAHVYPREALMVTTLTGVHVKGKPIAVKSDSITLKHGFATTTIPKAKISVVDYFRVKPETDNFDFVLEEAPWAIIFYPEFYSRTAGLEGRIPVRLYDASKPEDNRTLDCQKR